METVLLKYNSGGTTKTLNALFVRGLDDGDEVQVHYGFVNTSDDGTLYENMDSFRRAITVDFGVVSSSTDRTFLFNWYKALDKTISLNGGADLAVVANDPALFSNVWLNNVKISKKYVLKLREKTTWTSVPW